MHRAVSSGLSYLGGVLYVGGIAWGVVERHYGSGITGAGFMHRTVDMTNGWSSLYPCGIQVMRYTVC